MPPHACFACYLQEINRRLAYRHPTPNAAYGAIAAIFAAIVLSEIR